jgi:signal transduction histidine kinase/CheY-like chemotaxis protein
MQGCNELMNKAHDLFLLMLNLSQYKTSEKILDFFLAAMENTWEGLNFRFHGRLDEVAGSAKKNEEVFPIATQTHRFGVVVVRGKPAAKKDIALIRNAVQALAIILENREQEKLLANEKIHLEEAVKERTAELIAVNEQLKRKMEEQKRLENQLLQARKMEAIGTMAGGIAHDFNNILGAVVGYTELVKLKLDENRPEQHYLSQVLKVAERARDTVNQILTFSRKNNLERSPVLLEPLIHETLKILRATLPSTIEIRKIPGDYSKAVLANPAQIQQVILNLSTNAADAMAAMERGAVLEIGLKELTEKPEGCLISPKSKSGSFFQLTVRDSGAGIEPPARDRIFEPFFTTRGHGTHSGMGLAVVHGIIKSYGGDIRVETGPGEGTAVHILLPAFPTGEEEEPGETENPPGTQRGSETVLFVDDEPHLVDAGSQALEAFGYNVVAATGSEEALEIFKQDPEKFHLIITDYTMPHMTGLQLAKIIRGIRADIPVILCTGYSDPVARNQLEEAGIRKLIHKPYTQAKISKTIRNVLD